jgi:hypothetical protein
LCGVARGVVAESVECSDDGWEAGEAHWGFIGNFAEEEQVNVPNQSQERFGILSNGGGTGTASEVFQMLCSTLPRPIMTLDMWDPCNLTTITPLDLLFPQS